MPEGETFHQAFDTLIADRFIIGSSEECYEQPRPYWERIGANHLIFKTHWIGMPVEMALESMALISKELLPALHRIQI